MKIFKVWHFICFIFAFNSLTTLFEESYEVVYEKADEIEETKVRFLVCVELSRLYSENETIDLKKSGDDLHAYFDCSIDNRGREDDPSLFEELVLNRTKSGGWMIFNGMVCLNAKDKWELGEIYWLLNWDALLFAIQKETFDLVEMKDPYENIEQLTVLRREHLYSNCSKSNSRFFCLNDCFKRSFRLARYLYNSSETAIIHLNYSSGPKAIEESEKNCFRECRKENCKMIQLISALFKKDSKPETFVASFKLSDFDFWLQLIGLVCSFTGLSFHEFTSVAIKFAQSKVRRRKIKIGLLCLKWIILFLSLASLGYLLTRTILEHNDKTEIEKGITKSLIQPKTVYLAICLYMKMDIFNNKRMSEIEMATNGMLNDTLEGIYLTYPGRSFPTNYQVHPKVLFFYYMRCFSLSIQPIYQTIPSNPKLEIKFKIELLHYIYLLSENEAFNQKSFKYSDLFTFMKRIVKRSGGDCVDYQEKNATCTGRWNCIDWCINRQFIDRYNRSTFGYHPHHVIDRDWFSPTEWNTSYLMDILYKNRSIYEDIRANCSNQIPNEKPFVEIKFKEAVQTSDALEPLYKEIDLKFEVESWVEESASSSYKLLLDLVSIQGIVFGFTVLGLLQIVCPLIQHKKIVLFSVYLLCSIMASWHTYHIFRVIITGELLSTRSYRLAVKIQMPEMVFCDQIDLSGIDRNRKLTGNHLEELTVNVTEERMFKDITFLNESNKWVPFNRNLVKRFFFLNMKCFSFQTDQAYNKNQFHLSTERRVFMVNFNKTQDEKFVVYFMTKSEETEEFSQIVNLIYSYYMNRKYLITQETPCYEYEDRFDFIRRYFISFSEDDLSNLNSQLLELQRNQIYFKTLNTPLEEKEFGLELDEGLFDQLYFDRKNQNRQTNLNKQQQFVNNHLKFTVIESDPDFVFNLDFLEKIVSSTNEENIGMILLSLLNVLCIWFDLGVLDLHPVFNYFYAPVPLLADLALFLFIKTTLAISFSHRRLKPFEAPLFERLNAHKKNSQPNNPV